LLIERRTWWRRFRSSGRDSRERVIGDRSDFEDLVGSHHPRLRAFAGRVLDSGSAAEDALQDAYLKAYRAYPPRSQDRLDAWLTTIVYRSCLDTIRSARRRPTQPLDDASSAGWDGAPDHAVPAALDLAAAFRGLSAEARAAVTLVDVLGFDYEAAARVLGTNRGTIASRLHTARGLLRQHLSTYQEETRTNERAD
jgi:RNA polymerase sigma-70 factor (ECF subfamily)